jgi:hypothetical protein
LLVRFFLLFGSFLSIPSIYFYWHRILTKPHFNIFAEITPLLFLEGLIGSIAYYLLFLSGWI